MLASLCLNVIASSLTVGSSVFLSHEDNEFRKIFPRCQVPYAFPKMWLTDRNDKSHFRTVNKIENNASFALLSFKSKYMSVRRHFDGPINPSRKNSC